MRENKTSDPPLVNSGRMLLVTESYWVNCNTPVRYYVLCLCSPTPVAVAMLHRCNISHSSERDAADRLTAAFAFSALIGWARPPLLGRRTQSGSADGHNSTFADPPLISSSS